MDKCTEHRSSHVANCRAAYALNHDSAQAVMLPARNQIIIELYAKLASESHGSNCFAVVEVKRSPRTSIEIPLPGTSSRSAKSSGPSCSAKNGVHRPLSLATNSSRESVQSTNALYMLRSKTPCLRSRLLSWASAQSFTVTFPNSHSLDDTKCMLKLVPGSRVHAAAVQFGP